jgi:hypothetical protein
MNSAIPTQTNISPTQVATNLDDMPGDDEEGGDNIL